MTRDFKKNFLIDLIFVLVIGALIYFAFKFLMIYLFPFIIGLLITAFVQRPSGYISEKIKIKKGNCALIFVILIYLVLFALIFFFGYKIVDFISYIANNIPDIFRYFEDVFINLNEKLSGITKGMPNGVSESFSRAFENIIASLANETTSILSSFAAGAATHAPGVIISIVVTIVASCYIAKDYDDVKRFFLGHISATTYEILSKTKSIVTDKILKIVKGYLLIMLITFVELSVGLLLLKVENALLLALLIAILDLLPVLGTGTVLIPWGIVNLLLGNYFIGVALIVLYVIVLIVRNIIEPKIISKQVGLHPLITLLCIFIGLKLFGFIGMLLLPLATILVFNFYKDGDFSGIGLSKKAN